MILKHGRPAGRMAVAGPLSSANEGNGFVSKALAFCSAAFDRLHSEQVIRQSIEKLHELDDETLRDIGLRRSEIESYVRTKAKSARPASRS